MPQCDTLHALVRDYRLPRNVLLNVEHRLMLHFAPDLETLSLLQKVPHQIAPPPPTVAGLGQEYLTGLVKLEGRLLIMLDIDELLGRDETAALDAAMAGA